MSSESSDVQILDDVLEALRRDPEVGPAEVGIEVDDGVVTLTGTVDRYETKLAAIEVAHRTAGVLDVVNNIQMHVSGAAGRTDTEIATAVRRALRADALVPDERISTTIARGWVTLAGAVGRRRQRDAAEQAVRRVPGVAHIINDIAVMPGVAVRPSAVQNAIEHALERHTEREVDRLCITIADGAVTLSGTVDTLSEKRAAIGAAGHVPGICKVIDELCVDPHGDEVER